MKINKSYLQQIIKEELTSVLEEADDLKGLQNSWKKARDNYYELKKKMQAANKAQDWKEARRLEVYRVEPAKKDMDAAKRKLDKFKSVAGDAALKRGASAAADADAFDRSAMPGSMYTKPKAGPVRTPHPGKHVKWAQSQLDTIKAGPSGGLFPDKTKQYNYDNAVKNKDKAQAIIDTWRGGVDIDPEKLAAYDPDQMLMRQADKDIDAMDKPVDKPAKKNSSFADLIRRKARSQARLSQKHNIDVKEIQKLLKIKQDGKYGKDTYRKIRAYQKANGLKPDGLVGKDTIAKMRKASTSPAKQKQVATTKQPSEIERLKAEFDAATKNVIDAYKGDIGKQNNLDWQKDYNILVSRAKAAGKAYAAAKGADHDKKIAALTAKRQLAAARRKGLQNIKTANQKTR